MRKFSFNIPIKSPFYVVFKKGENYIAKWK